MSCCGYHTLQWYYTYPQNAYKWTTIRGQPAKEPFVPGGCGCAARAQTGQCPCGAQCRCPNCPVHSIKESYFPEITGIRTTDYGTPTPQNAVSWYDTNMGWYRA